MASVSVDDAGKYNGAFESLEGVSIDIEDGAFVVRFGPSCCGKSTLLRMIGLESIASGEIAIGDRVVNTLPPRSGTSIWCSSPSISSTKAAPG